MTSCHCCASDKEFDRRRARRDARRLRRRGPDPGTQQLLDAIRAAPLSLRPTLLDIGGGVGTIHHALLDQGFVHATHVDASAAYLAVAATEAERLSHANRVTFEHADFRTVAAALQAADVVTLDRVVCCDPDFTSLLAAAADHARRLLGFTYPRPRWYNRAFVAIANAWRWLQGSAFRAYIHPPAAMIAVLEQHGLRARWSGGTWIWAVEVFERVA